MSQIPDISTNRADGSSLDRKDLFTICQETSVKCKLVNFEFSFLTVVREKREDHVAIFGISGPSRDLYGSSFTAVVMATAQALL
jgi:hypothetical protein